MIGDRERRPGAENGGKMTEGGRVKETARCAFRCLSQPLPFAPCLLDVVVLMAAALGVGGAGKRVDEGDST